MNIQDLTVQSGFVFEGEVVGLESPATPGAPGSATVRVGRVLKSPATLSRYAGQLVTVHLKGPIDLQPGDQAAFFTHGVHYGKRLTVAENGHVQTIEHQVRGAASRARNSELGQRLAQAQLVVSGMASAPASFAAASLPRRFSEHDADWATAIVTIDKVEKGMHSEPTVGVLFARSMDIAWHRAPKIRSGDRGVWLLHNRDLRQKAVPALAVVHPLDFQPGPEVDRVRALLKA